MFGQKKYFSKSKKIRSFVFYALPLPIAVFRIHHKKTIKVANFAIFLSKYRKCYVNFLDKK